MDDEQPTSESGPLADWFEWIEPEVASQRPEGVTEAGEKSDLDDTTTDLPARLWPLQADRLTELAELATWVNGLQKEYAAAGDWLVPCWWRHRFAINELAALRVAWLGTEESDEWSAELDWHEAAEKCRERIRQAIGNGAGCTATKHHPDWPVTRDERWKDERTALFSIFPDGAGRGDTT